MDIASKYEPVLTEDKWYKYWLNNGFFSSQPDHREPYCIVIPPPNVTGVLHMGHMLNNTIQDVLIRRARMLGKNALWVPGTDHASIATEAKVVAMLKEKGIDKKNISREEFLDYAWQWKEKHGGIILEQLKKLGASCDWSRTKFTMDEDMYESVIDVFIDLYNKGYIYRGVRMVNWDPKALTALSDEEVNYKEVQSKLYYIRYKIIDTTEQWIIIATTRPETILGDTAICVNPSDERYIHLKNKKALLPLLNRELPIIFDDYVDKDFGTGALKVTPAHDINDYNLGLKYQLPSIDIFNDNGTLNQNAQLFIGEDRFVVREKIVQLLNANSHLVKIEEFTNSIGVSERTDAVIEPKLSLQWFCKMSHISKPALEKVMDDTIKFYPPKFKNTYKHWFENIKDWCISRQLWWGQRIPAWYAPDGSFVVAKTPQQAINLFAEKNINLNISQIRQDDDVLDTWFSSWLWPISVFDGIRNPGNKDIQYYYPTNDLITAPEILFFWVARMIMAGYLYCNDKPFSNVYLTGIVRDAHRRKMSKSLGNSPDPLLLIQNYGADGVRAGMLFSSPAGNDLLFDESYCQQGRNFNNKIWNAFRLIKGWNIDNSIQQPEYSITAINWFNQKLDTSIAIIDDHFSKFRLSDALLEIYKLIWDEFCSWFLEMIKPPYLQPIDANTFNQTINIFEKLLKLLHPFMPFITEEIYQSLSPRKPLDSIMISSLPIPSTDSMHSELIPKFDFAKQVISEIRNIRKSNNIPQKNSLHLYIIKNNDEKVDLTFDALVQKLCNINDISYVTQKPANALSFIINTTEFFIPFEENIDKQAESIKLQAELEYNKGFLNSVISKLNNERFVKNAPANVLENERKKLSDTQAKIKVLEEKLKNLA